MVNGIDQNGIVLVYRGGRMSYLAAMSVPSGRKNFE